MNEMHHEEALIRLLDDPDPLVFNTVWNKILDGGQAMIPILEKEWRQSRDSSMLENIEELIRQIRLGLLTAEMERWIKNPEGTLWEGSLLLARLQYPEFSGSDLHLLTDPIRHEIWLEISPRLTALEKIKVVNHIIFEKLGFVLDIKQPDSPGNHFINRLIETKKGNPISISIFYSLICQELGLPVYGVNLPGSMVLAYHDLPVWVPESRIPLETGVLFYVNPANQGAILGHRDIMFYLVQNKFSTDPDKFRAASAQTIIHRQLKRLMADYITFGNIKRSGHVQLLLDLWKEKSGEK